MNRYVSKYSGKISENGRTFLAETMGTFIMMMFGLGCNAQYVLGEGRYGSILIVYLGWGLACCLGVYWSIGISVSGRSTISAKSMEYYDFLREVFPELSPPQSLLGIVCKYTTAGCELLYTCTPTSMPTSTPVPYGEILEGGHLNPAVSLGMSVVGRLSFRKLPIYWTAQTLGSFLASALCFAIYKDLLDEYEGKKRTMMTARIFSTYLHEGVSKPTGFGDQMIGTTLLVSTIFALTDKRNNPPSSGSLPVLIGLIIVTLGMCFGINCGYAVNPVRDLIPRIFTAIAGWGKEPFQKDHYWFWIPIAGQLCGGVVGSILYMLTIELHHPNERHRESLIEDYD